MPAARDCQEWPPVAPHDVVQVSTIALLAGRALAIWRCNGWPVARVVTVISEKVWVAKR